MNVVTSIIDLLQIHEKVVISGLGFFKEEVESAKVTLGAATFQPPKHSLNFVNDKNSKDNSLVEYLAFNKGIDQEDAQIEVDVFIDKLKHIIEHEEEHELEGLGSFQGRYGRLRFNPSVYDQIVNASLPAFNSKPIERTAAEKTSVISNKIEPVTTKYERQKPAIEWWRILIGVFLFSMLGFTIWKLATSSPPKVAANNQIAQTDADERKATSNEASNTSVELTQDNTDGESDSPTSKEITVTSAGDPKETESSKNHNAIKSNIISSIEIDDEEIIPRIYEKDKCVIIVGVFGSQVNVDKMIGRVRAMGYQTFTNQFISRGTALTRVGAKIHCDESSIRTTLNELRSIDANAWLVPKD